ncbi:MAG: single-stranded DNA-binding protein [Anaerolineaceae bacterium]|nr:single-stranded DNA-binding protein [Anaerolineaceae bacterium]
MFHTIIIVGNVGKEPEMRYTPSGKAVTSFSLASSQNRSGQNGQQTKETVWFKISVWEKQAETVSQYVHKGSKVLVEGRLNFDPATGSPRVWTRQDGTPGASFEVTASTVRFLSPKGEGAGGPGEDAGEVPGDAGEGDIPF